MNKIKLIVTTAVSFLLLFVVSSGNVQATQKTIHTNYYEGIKSTSLSYSINGKNLLSRIKTNTTMKYYGSPRRIKGQKYVCYNIGKGKYVPLDSIGKVNGRNTFRLLKNSYIYNAKGRKIGSLSYRYPVYFSGSLRKTSQDKRYYVLERNIDSQAYTTSTEKYYLPYKKIKNSYYYSLGKGRYINVRNVATINGLQNCSNSEKITVTAPGRQTVPVYVENNSSDEKAGKWLPGAVNTKYGTAYRVIVDGKTVNVVTGDMILGQRIPSGTTVTVNARTSGPQYRYQIKGTHTFIDATNVVRKKTSVANYLPYYLDLDELNN
ncbi:hypothetical protein H4B44_05290 [Lactobacillus ultunensis]|nr:hypothetical protein H4B44_05290 [Lactobacillus ultunensis]